MTTPFAEGVEAIRRGDTSVLDVARQLIDRLDSRARLGLLDGDQGFWAGAVDMAINGYNARPIVAGAVARLGIPGIRFTDGPRGVVMGRSTCFPVALARGATWDVALEEEIGRAIGLEGRAQGANLFAGVCINLLRHPAWGRAQETYGEDPVHLAAMGTALTRGAREQLMVCVKHFALNSIENARFVVDVEVDEAALHEVYLPHFKAVIGAGAEAVMSAYNSVNGEWCGDSPTLLTRILRDEWGFEGFVMSDFIFGHRDPIGSLAAGLDLEMPFRQQRAPVLPRALADGSLPSEIVSVAAKRLLTAQLRYAARMTEPPPPIDVVACSAHRALARRAAARSMVLLRNACVDGQPLLPLSVDRLERVAVIGKLAARANVGDYGSSAVRPPYVVTLLDGVRAALPDASVEYDGGRRIDAAVALARDSDVAIVVVGYGAHDEGEAVLAPIDRGASVFPWPLGRPPLSKWVGAAVNAVSRLGVIPGGDRRSLRLRPHEEALIAAVAAANPRTLVVITGGAGVILERWRERVPAILLAWYPGMEGGNALADVLFGKTEPGGRLPVTMARDERDLPFFDRAARRIRYDRWWGQRLLDRRGVTAAYPLGFGLGYTTFELSEPQVEAGSATGDGLVVSVSVRNVGARAGGTVVQLYWEPMAGGDSEVAPRQLAGFARASLAAGEAARVQVVVTTKPISKRDPGTHGWSVRQDRFRLSIGQHSGDPNAQIVEMASANPTNSPKL